MLAREKPRDQTWTNDYKQVDVCKNAMEAPVTEFTAGTYEYFSRIRDTPFAARHHESAPLCEDARIDW